MPVYAELDYLTEEAYHDLPDHFVIKANHGCGLNLIVKNKADYFYQDLKQITDKWLKTKFHRLYLEYHYKNIQPRLLVQKLLMDKHGNIPNDYKCSYFHNNGDPVIYINVMSGRYNNLKLDIFDEKWNYLNGKFQQPVKDSPAPPAQLDKMIELTKKLGASFDHVRVDFFETDGQLYFGELTFTPCAGFNDLGSRNTDREWGRLWGNKSAA